MGGGGGLEVTADDQRPVRWEGGWGWGLEATADDQRQVVCPVRGGPAVGAGVSEEGG